MECRINYQQTAVDQTEIAKNKYFLQIISHIVIRAVEGEGEQTHSKYNLF